LGDRWFVNRLENSSGRVLVPSKLDWDPGSDASNKISNELSLKNNQVTLYDLNHIVAQNEINYSNNADIAIPLYISKTATVHLHILGFEQRVPLHVHKNAEEIVIIVTGRPSVGHLYGEGAEIKKSVATYFPGDLVYSAPYTGHEWFNPSINQFQANLVFSKPPFAGNFYILEDDNKLFKGSKPVNIRKDNLGDEGVNSGIFKNLIPGYYVNVMTLVNEELSFANEQDTILVIISGNGVLLSKDRKTLRPNSFVVIKKNRPFTLINTSSEPLILYHLHP